MTSLRSQSGRFTVPFTAFLVLGFGGLTVLGVASQFYLGLTTAQANTRELLRDKAHATISGIESKIRSTLDPVVAASWAVVRQVAHGTVEVADEGFDARVIGALTASPHLESIAARLEELNKVYGTDILISESTVRAVPGQGFRSLGEAEVRGRTEPVAVYTL